MSGFLPHLAMAACAIGFGFLCGVIWHMGRQQERDALICGAIGLLRQRIDALQAAIEDR